MRKSLLSVLFIIIAFAADAQVFPSDCTAPDSVKNAYKTDAQRLGLRRVYKFHAAEMDSTHIPGDRTDTALNALILVYNATTLPARDTVTDMLHIHSFADGGLDSPFSFTMNKLRIYANETEQWMQDFKLGIIPTSDPVINTFLTNYELTLDNYDDLTSGLDGLFFTSDSNYNLGAVAQEWGQAYFAIGGDVGINGDGPDIFLDTVTSTYTQLTFRYGWVACGSGCIYNRYWTFQANYDCTVTYMGSYGDTLPWTPNGLSPELFTNATVVYPNPFTDKIMVKNIAAKTRYAIYSATGILVKQGSVSNEEPVAVDALPGMYILRLTDDKGSRIVKLLKE